MSQFAAESVPSSLEPVLAEFLNRQLNAIQLAFMSEFIATSVDELPTRPIVGAIVYLRGQEDPANNGFYGCVEDSQGAGQWKKLST